MNSIEAVFESRTPGSASDVKRRARSMPGGNTRAMVQYLPYPVVLERAEGAVLTDVDDNDYIDLNYNYATLLHGHAYPPIVEAVAKQLPKGTIWAAPSVQQMELAEELAARLPSVEQVRFCNSGTEANLLAVRLARAVTGRQLLVKAQFGFHGSYPELLAGTPFDDMKSGGVASVDTARTRVAKYGDLESFRRVLRENQGDVAAVFVEPFMFAAGVVPAPPGFLAALAEEAQSAGAMFILDEVVSLRFSRGGAQQIEGVRPDITVMGKTIGGGFPMGAIGGPARHMSYLDPTAARKLAHPHSGTFNGHLASCVAGLIALRDLTEERIAGMARAAEEIQVHLQSEGSRLGLPVHVSRAGSILNLYFLPGLPSVPVLREDSELIRLFHLACLNRGLFLSPKGMMAMSTVISQSVLREIKARLSAAMEDVAGAAPQSGQMNAVGTRVQESTSTA